MAAKTYVPGLRIALKTLIKYITLYQNVIKTSISDQAYECLIATLSAANECLALVPAPEKGD